MLDSITVVAHSYTSPIKGVGSSTIQWDSQSFQYLPQILSSSDPLRLAQLLPAVQTNTDFDASLHIYGCENMHNRYSIDGITVFNPSHLLGLFSTFSSDHFQEMFLTKGATTASFPNILGGRIDMVSNEQTDSLHLKLNVGLIFSEANLQIPTGHQSALSLSGRISYLNWLYSPLLKVDNSEIRYDLSDYNLGWTWHVSQHDTISLTAYLGQDELLLEDATSSHLKWGNRLAGLRWRHGGLSSHILLLGYVSNYSNKLHLNEGFLQFQCPTSMTDIGLSGKLTILNMSVNLDHVYHIFGLDAEKKYAQETSLSADWSQSFDNGFSFSAGARFSDYRQVRTASYRKTVIDPVFCLNYADPVIGEWSLVFNAHHQFLQQTRISQLGLPIEFYIPSSEQIQPQCARSITLSHHTLFHHGQWQLCVEAFLMQLSHQKEYIGNGLDLISYDINQYVEQVSDGEGKNFGIDLILSKRTGRLSGWCSLTLSRALRRFSCFDYMFPASHERRYDLNILASYRINSQLSVSGTYIVADGTPFTAPQYFYMLDGRILSGYGRYNANRLPTYHRLDLALAWHIPTRQSFSQCINLSVYNVFFNENASFYRLKLIDNMFGYRPLTFMPYAIPSLSYTITY